MRGRAGSDRAARHGQDGFLGTGSLRCGGCRGGLMHTAKFVTSSLGLRFPAMGATGLSPWELLGPAYMADSRHEAMGPAIVRKLWNLQNPTIAAVNGVALWPGLWRRPIMRHAHGLRSRLLL